MLKFHICLLWSYSERRLVPVSIALKQHYDKLLHITCTFTLLMFAEKWLPSILAVIVVLLLQVAKTIRNGIKDKDYIPKGDWLANAIGYLIWVLWRAL